MMKPLLKLFTVWLLALNVNTAKAQVDTGTTEKLISYIMQSVDKSQVPTGFLREMGAHLIPMQTFNGTLTDSNRIDINLWRALYFQLQTSYVGNGTNPLPAITAVNATIKNNDTGIGQPIPMPILIGTYNTVAGDAFSNNLLYYNSSQNRVYDVANRTQSPYTGNTVFAACALRNQTITGNDNFIIPGNLVYNNTGKTISQISIDVDNGQGFTNVSIGSAFTATYTDTGYKRWTIKVAFTDNSELQCYQDYYVLKASAAYTTFSYSYTGGSATNQIYIAPTANYSGGIATVVYSNNNFSGTLRKPLIVIEGYDVFSIARSLQPQPYTFRNFIDALQDARTPTWDFNHQLDDIAGYDLVFLTFYNGTDDITKNALVVEELIRQVNALKVNDDRPTSGSIRQQNVVMGLSMGGLCARYGLAQMTKNNETTETRLLITHDSPHEGANVPLGLQYFIRMLGGFQLFGTNVYSRNVFPEYDDAINLFNAPATQQLLLYRSTDANNYVANTFLSTTYRNMITFSANDPQPTYQFIATSLGSECGHQLYAPYKTFLNAGAGVGAGITANFLFFRLPIVTYELGFQAEAYSLPAQGTVAKIARLYTINQLQLFGFINIVKQLYNNTAYSDGNTLPVDGVAGSTSPLLDVQALRDLSNISTFPPISLYIQFPIYHFIGGYFNAYAYNAGFSYSFAFVPTASALDVSPFNTSAFSQSYVNGTNQNYPSKSSTFIAQETISASNSINATNNEHIRFTARNSQWLFDQMENIADNLNCSSECSNSYYIEGDALICSAGFYYIPGLSSGATVAWSASPSGIVSLATSGNTATLTKITDGDITLTATLNNACGTSNIILQKTVHTGLPIVLIDNNNITASSNPSTPDYNDVCTLQSTTLTMEVTGATSVTWSGPSHLVANWHTNGNNLVFYFYGNNQQAVFQITATNSCGSITKYYAFNSIDCSGGGDPCGGGLTTFNVSVSPNPSTNKIIVVPNVPPPCNELQLQATNNNKTQQQTTMSANNLKTTINPAVDKRVIKSIEIYNATGKLCKTLQYNNSQQAAVDVSNLATGMYVLKISNGEKTVQKKILVQH